MIACPTCETSLGWQPGESGIYLCTGCSQFIYLDCSLQPMLTTVEFLIDVPPHVLRRMFTDREAMISQWMQGTPPTEFAALICRKRRNAQL